MVVDSQIDRSVLGIDTPEKVVDAGHPCSDCPLFERTWKGTAERPRGFRPVGTLQPFRQPGLVQPPRWAAAQIHAVEPKQMTGWIPFSSSHNDLPPRTKTAISKPNHDQLAVGGRLVRWDRVLEISEVTLRLRCVKQRNRSPGHRTDVIARSAHASKWKAGCTIDLLRAYAGGPSS